MMTALSLPNFEGGVHNCPRGSITILRWLRKWELERGGSQACRQSASSALFGAYVRAAFTMAYVPHSHRSTCPIHSGIRAPFTQAYMPHLHTRVRFPFTHVYPPLSHRRTFPIHTSVRTAPFTLGGRARGSRFTLTLASSQGSFGVALLCPASQAQYPAHPAWRPHVPHLPSQLSHSCRTHPSAHLYSPPTVVLIPLSRVCTGSFVYVLLLLS